MTKPRRKVNDYGEHVELVDARQQWLGDKERNRDALALLQSVIGDAMQRCLRPGFHGTLTLTLHVRDGYIQDEVMEREISTKHRY